MTRQHYYDMRNDKNRERAKTIVDAISASPEQSMSSKEVATAIGMNRSTTANFLSAMHNAGFITPRKHRTGPSHAFHWTVGSDPAIAQNIATTQFVGDRIIRQVKAKDCTGPVPVDPMTALLFGNRRTPH